MSKIKEGMEAMKTAVTGGSQQVRGSQLVHCDPFPAVRPHLTSSLSPPRPPSQKTHGTETTAPKTQVTQQPVRRRASKVDASLSNDTLTALKPSSFLVSRSATRRS
jgi:hypothetical protein